MYLTNYVVFGTIISIKKAILNRATRSLFFQRVACFRVKETRPYKFQFLKKHGFFIPILSFECSIDLPNRENDCKSCYQQFLHEKEYFDYDKQKSRLGSTTRIGLNFTLYLDFATYNVYNSHKQVNKQRRERISWLDSKFLLSVTSTYREVVYQKTASNDGVFLFSVCH